MKEFWYWSELIGFDKDVSDCGVGAFLERIPEKVTGINLLLYSIDFVNMHRGMETEYFLGNGVCSYRGHPYNSERKIQKWTNYDLKRLIGNLQKEGVAVVFSYFNFYDYFNDNGMIVCDEFSLLHPELREQNNEGEPQKFLSPIKRFADGTYYEDYLASQTRKIFKDYGFDGVVLADGISSFRLSLQSGDFSDDLIFQFIEKKIASLPAEFCLPCEKDRTAYVARRNYIFERLYAEWAEFISERFASFVSKQAEIAEKFSKQLIVNSVWTRDPFEAFCRYGIDYRQIINEKIYAVMVEDCGATFAQLSDEQLCCDRMPSDRRRYSNYEFLYAEMALRAALPNIKHLSMTSLQDTLEDWNVIQEAYPEFKKSVFRRSNAFYWQNGKFIPCSDGAMFCMSDGVNAQTWKTVHLCETQSGGAEEPCCFAALYVSDVKGETKAYVDMLQCPSSKIYYDLLCGGCSVSCITAPKELKNFPLPVIAADLSFYTSAELRCLEEFSNPLFVFGKEKVLKKSPVLTLREKQTGTYCFCYHLTAYQTKLLLSEIALSDCFSRAEYVPNTRRKTPVTEVNEKRRLKEPALYTQELVFADVFTKSLRWIGPVLNKVCGFPVSESKDECKFSLFRSGSAYRLVIYNDEYHAATVAVRLPFPIGKVRAVSRPFWYEISAENGMVRCTVNARSAEILEFSVSEED